mgnify:CR=1 FL=1
MAGRAWMEPCRIDAARFKLPAEKLLLSVSSCQIQVVLRLVDLFSCTVRRDFFFFVR